MRRLFFTSFITLLLSICAFAQTSTPTPDMTKDDGDVVKIRTNLIQLDVVVTGKNGKQITDLKPEDFEVLENGKKQEITNFSYVSVGRNTASNNSASNTAPKSNADPTAPVVPKKLQPEQVRRTVALVVDDLGLSFQSMVYVRSALKRFVDEQIQPDDLVAIVRTAGDIGATQQFTSDKRQLYAAIEKVRWYPLGRSGSNAVSSEGQSASENRSQRDSFTEGTLGALNYIVSGMRELPGRKAIVLLSEGMPLTTSDTEDGIDETGQIVNAVRLLGEMANRASVVINTVDARGLSVSVNRGTSIGEASSIMEVIQPNVGMSNYDVKEGMLTIAEQTGGRAFINNNDIKGSIDSILRDQSGYYLIAYQPDETTFDPNNRHFNKLQVKVNRSGANANYRNGFYNFAEQDIAPSADQTPEEQMLTAITSPFGIRNGINLRLNSLFTNDSKNGSFIRSLLHVSAKDLQFTDEANGDKKAVFDVAAYTFGDNGVSVDKTVQSYTMIVKQEEYQKMLNKGFVYRINLPVKKPGAFQMRVALRDTQGGKLGAASQFIQVPDLTKGYLALSSIVLQGLTKEQVQKITAEQSLLVEKKNSEEIDPETDTALRRFQVGSFLQYGYTIYNSKRDAAQRPQLETQLRIFRDGKLLLERKPQPLETNGQTGDERIPFNGAMALPPEMTPGEYVLQVIVRDKLAESKSQLAMQWVDFEIVK